MYITNLLRVNGLIRLTSTLGCILLLTASLTLIVEAIYHPKPLFQIPSILLTLASAFLIFYAGSFAVRGDRFTSTVLWGLCLFIILAQSSLQFLPLEYDTLMLLRLKALSPPFWPYTLSIPLLMFLILDNAIKSSYPNKTSLMFLMIGLVAVTMFLFMTTVLVGTVANISELVFIPTRMFWVMASPVLLSMLVVLGIVFVRKGFVISGVLMLISIGLFIEWVSTWSYDGPYFLETANRLNYDMFPALPFISGTIPGMILAILGVVVVWRATSETKKPNENDEFYEEI